MSSSKPAIDAAEVAKHTSPDDCWIIVHDQVYDVTEWLNEHPGGSKIILKYAGKDATEEYEPIHPPDAITENLPEDKHLGPIQADSVKKVVKEVTAEERAIEDKMAKRPPLSEILNLHDFEALAGKLLKDKAWAYYSSGADDEITMRENHLAYHRIWFRPRILRDVSTVDFSTTVLGCKTSMPVYVTATALGKLGHPLGEVNLTKAAGKHGVIQMIPTLASCSFDELVDAAVDGQDQFFQLYVNADRERTKKIVQHAEKRGIKALFITVDAPQLGRREKDMRMSFDQEQDSQVQRTDSNVKRDEGAARAISSFIDPGLSWKDLKWFKSITKLPIILKGVQRWEDAVLAAEAGCQGVVLSNHGGRQLEFARSGIEVLAEVTRELKKRKLFPSKDFQIFVDGGVRRASDVLKAVAMGATAVGVGRPFLYAMSTYGQEGVERAFQILKDEFEMNMRLIGARTIDEVTEDMVDANSVTTHITIPGDSRYTQNYQSLVSSDLRPNL